MGARPGPDVTFGTAGRFVVSSTGLRSHESMFHTKLESVRSEIIFFQYKNGLNPAFHFKYLSVVE